MRAKQWIQKILAGVLAVGMAVTLPGMSAFAGATGQGAATLTKEEGGPGVAMQSELEETADPDYQGTPKIGYSLYISGQDWSQTVEDNTLLTLPAGRWATAVWAQLVDAPTNLTLEYQANVSGSGWLDWVSEKTTFGTTQEETPLEAIRMRLGGLAADNYDLYYRVYQQNAWSDWAMNGEKAGQDEVGQWICGLRASIMPKGSGEPQETVVQGIDPTKPMIALTFDDGPRTEVTSRILDSLQANGGRATFFMVGNRVAANAAVVKRMVEQGCEVANHTYDHKYISKIGAAAIRQQLAATNQQVQAACGVTPTLMRPPGGYKDAASLATVGSMGMTAIMWSIDTRDWQHRNAQRTIQTVLSQVKDGDIVLMHDSHVATGDAAVVLIPELVARGYQLVTVSELASYRGGMVAGHSYSQFHP